MPSGHLLSFACVTCGAIHSVGSDSIGFSVRDIDNPTCNDIGLWFAWRQLNGPLPGGRGFQEQWRRGRKEFCRQHNGCTCESSNPQADFTHKDDCPERGETP